MRLRRPLALAPECLLAEALPGAWAGGTICVGHRGRSASVDQGRPLALRSFNQRALNEGFQVA
jgi:hypothetical protein